MGISCALLGRLASSPEGIWLRLGDLRAAHLLMLLQFCRGF